jgi:hypothetical protein
MRTIADFDRELEILGRQHAQIWGQIQQLQMQRNFELVRLARETARNEPHVTYAPARWNDHGFNANAEIPDLPDELEAVR